MIKYLKVNDIPKEWDNLIGDNLYMSLDFLKFLEDVEDYNQAYYALFDDEGKMDTIFMSFILPEYNLAMFTNFNLVQKMTMIYVPLSVTRPGIIYGKHLNEALEYIKKIKGPKMILNLGDLEAKGFAKGLTCPKCILTNRFNSFENYLDSMRSNYRQRYKKCFKKSKDLKLEYLVDNNDFNEEMYQCYLNVYNKSKVKLEKLPIEFFRGKYFKIFVLKLENKPVGFGQMLANGSELIFEFVGVDYEYNNQYDIYHRILLEIVKYGIENGFKTIDFGQTADDSKLRLGAKYTKLYAYLHTTNILTNFINKRLARFIEYKPVKIDYNIFKED